MGIREFTPHPTTKKQPNLEYPESSRKIRKEKKQQKRRGEQRRRRTNLLDDFFAECLRIQEN
jgi:hypothetical protein